MQNNQVRYPVTGHGHILISVPGFDRSGADCVYLMQQEGYFREGVIYGSDCGVQDLLLSGEYGIHRTQVTENTR